MSDEEEDYLSDKFLLETSTSNAPKTYSQLRKDALKKSALKKEQNQKKSRHQLELESRQEGLSTSLFERAQEAQASGTSSGNKALSMMMKMGFKPGQSLGTQGDNSSPQPASLPPEGPEVGEETSSSTQTQHIKVPLPLHEWTGKREAGIGVRKRPPSPASQQLVVKMAKLAESREQASFRGHAREQYLERRAAGRLGPTQSTCVTLDEKMGKSFNILWLNPEVESSFPPGLLDLIISHPTTTTLQLPSIPSSSKMISPKTTAQLLKQQMQKDALEPITDRDDDGNTIAVGTAPEPLPQESDSFSEGDIEQAIQFLRLNAQDRLTLVLSYLRNTHFYCFWCGTQYDGETELVTECPGELEDDHD